MQKGIHNIKKITKQLPNSSGVYKMISEQNEILYIGKAKNLHKRVNSYTNPNKLNNRLKKMISLIYKVEFITTEDECKALLLEASLIKEIKPKWYHNRYLWFGLGVFFTAGSVHMAGQIN